MAKSVGFDFVFALHRALFPLSSRSKTGVVSGVWEQLCKGPAPPDKRFAQFFGKKKLGHKADRPNVPKSLEYLSTALSGNGNWVQKGNWPSIIALLKALELSLFRYEERLGKQRDYDLKSKLMEEPLRSAETASHVETIEALKALATNRDFPTDMRSLSHRLLDNPVYMTIDVTDVTSGFDKYRRLRKALFVAHVVNPTFIKTKAAAQAIYEYITSDRLPKQRAAGHDHAILMSELALSCQDFDIIADLRDVSYLAAAFSTRDLVEQVVDKLKEKHHPQTLLEAGDHIPSISWVQYQFAPKHPSYRASLQYTGQCHVVLKDSVFQPSTPPRHAAELMSIARSCSMRGDITRGTPGVAFIMSDGGPDHNVSFYTVIASWLALFMELEMDVLTISRTTPTQSYMNRAECCMSELNKGLQNNALARVRVDDDFEKAFARCNSMTAIRAAAAKALNKELQAEADDEPMPPLAEDSDSDEDRGGM
eukprot:jgi/Tetstr1/421520/TSEL_012467.t1